MVLHDPRGRVSQPPKAAYLLSTCYGIDPGRPGLERDAAKHRGWWESSAASGKAPQRKEDGRVWCQPGREPRGFPALSSYLRSQQGLEREPVRQHQLT